MIGVESEWGSGGYDGAGCGERVSSPGFGPKANAQAPQGFNAGIAF